MKKRILIAAILTLSLGATGVASGGSFDPALHADGKGLVSPVSVANHPGEKTLSFVEFASPQFNERYRTVEILPVRLYIGYRTGEPFYPEMAFVLAQPAPGITGMEMGFDTGAFIGTDPSDPMLYVFEYGLNWRVPGLRMSPFGVPSGTSAYYQIHAQDQIFHPHEIVLSDLVIVTFVGKPSGFPIPHIDVGPVDGERTAKSLPALGSTETATSWGSVKSLFR